MTRLDHARMLSFQLSPWSKLERSLSKPDLIGPSGDDPPAAQALTLPSTLSNLRRPLDGTTHFRPPPVTIPK